MDIEPTEAIEGLRTDIGRVDARVERVEANLQRVEANLQRVETSLRGEIVLLRAEVHDLHDEAKRHVNVLFESLRDDIRIVAEGLAVLTMKVDSLQR